MPALPFSFSAPPTPAKTSSKFEFYTPPEPKFSVETAHGSTEVSVSEFDKQIAVHESSRTLADKVSVAKKTDGYRVFKNLDDYLVNFRLPTAEVLLEIYSALKGRKKIRDAEK